MIEKQGEESDNLEQTSKKLCSLPNSREDIEN
jgi:hypothetical protein